MAQELEEEGHLEAAAEVLRAVAAATGGHPEICFQIAELLYHSEQKSLERIESEQGIKINIEEDSNFHQEQYEITMR